MCIRDSVLAAKKTPVNEKLILEVADIFGNEPITIQEIKVLLQVSDNQPDVIRKAFKPVSYTHLVYYKG